MTSPFEFFGITRICFGRGQIARLGEIAGAFGKAALIIFNGPDLSAKLAAQLQQHGIATEFHRQRGEPTVADIDAAVAAARKIGCTMLIGIGGGSAIDAAKATAGILTNGGSTSLTAGGSTSLTAGGSAADYLEVVGSGKKITQPALPWIAVPTTAGTGAEVTRNAVIGLPEKQFKASIRSEHLLPRAAIVDPDLGLDVSPVATARSGMDALCQLIESYTSTGASPLTDALALSMVGRAARALPLAFNHGHDVEARSEMALSALVSGMTLASAGLGAVHGFAAPLGANYPAPHGAICAALLPPVIRANLAAARASSSADPAKRTLQRYADIGRAIFPDRQAGADRAADAVLQITASLVSQLNIGPLLQFGMKESDVSAMVALARKASSMRFNPLVLSDAALAEALTAAIRGDGIG
jgi:alcohol dehydrogenase class IV